ncbi:MAG TPA: hypothetical protein DCR44_05970 [Acholeplasmatales bacterium]|nr:MAG: hypothetical protein A2Y16_06200 [Tenericutes bacterium GWF2_57_13]HAQ56925.1 hypothetical protein [Acholeplasmatales bacterium]
MSMDLDMKERLNDLYRPLVERARQLLKMLRASGYPDATLGFYNGHYAKNDDGAYAMEWFPIPVLSVPALCDVEFAFDHFGITTKLKRANALAFDFGLLDGHRYQVYGVADYLSDFGDETCPAADLRKAISNSTETEVAYSFEFVMETTSQTLCDFIQFLPLCGFHY